MRPELGLSAGQLTPAHRWFNGPEFLRDVPEAWPSRKRIKEEESSSECLDEIKKPKLTFVVEGSCTTVDKSTTLDELEKATPS